MRIAGGPHFLLYGLGLAVMIKKEREHRHGGDARFDMARFNMPERNVIDFSVNLNPLGLPSIIEERWMEMMDGIERYPSLEGDGVAYYYQSRFHISPGNFLAGNGSTEMIYLLPRVLGFRSVVVISPSYDDYSRASIMAGARVIRHNLSPETRFSLTGRDHIVKALQDADALWLGHPNNPTGRLFQRELILELAKKFPEKWFIVDEAFMPFVEGGEEASLMVPKTRPNILVIHSLTKFYCLAGLRIGGVMGDGKVLSCLRKAKEPWTVNGVAERVAPILLECRDYEKKSHSLIKGERQRLFKALQSLKGIECYPSSANFILCQWHLTDNLDDLIRHLLSNGIYIRDCRNFHGLEKDFFRLAVRSPTENDRLMYYISTFPDHFNG